MSVHVMSWAWKQKLNDPLAKLVLVKLADQANDEGECWPSRKTISRDCEISTDTFDRRVKFLIELGLVNVEKRTRENGSSTSNLYRLRPLGAADSGPTPPQGSGPQNYQKEPSDEPLTPRKRDVVWDTFVDLFGEPTNKGTRGRMNRAVALVRESLDALEDVDAEAEIKKRAKLWPKLFPEAVLTDVALAHNWDRLVVKTGPTKPPPSAEAMPERVDEEGLKKVKELMEKLGG